MNVNQYIDEKRVSEITGRAVSTLQKDRFHGRGIQFCKIGRSCRYLLQDVLDFMESHKVQTEN